MPRIEITRSLDLNDEEEARCEMHSFCNVLNILMGELQVLGKILGDRETFSHSLSLCDTMLQSFTDRESAVASVRELEAHAGAILSEVEAAVSEARIPEEYEEVAASSVHGLMSIMDVVDVRVREVLARQKAQNQWMQLRSIDVAEGLRQVFRAIEETARGRYGIVFDAREQRADDYLIEIDVAGDESGVLHMPSVFVDVQRDVTANARKYSSPGTRIESLLHSDGTELLVKVTDQGRGIPSDEIERVVEYGVRGSNTHPGETKGGGFGLTKAYAVTKQYGGRMWIESEVGAGTCVEIRVPRPGRPSVKS